MDVAKHVVLMESERRSPADTSLPMEAFRDEVWVDYASAGLKVQHALAHLDEGIPNRQPARVKAAMNALREGAFEMEQWLRRNGWPV